MVAFAGVLGGWADDGSGRGVFAVTWELDAMFARGSGTKVEGEKLAKDRERK